MSAELKILQVENPLLEFGSPGQYMDPKTGLSEAGPFDLRFGNARKKNIQVGIVGPKDMLDKARRWIGRISSEIEPTVVQPYNKPFPGFNNIFQSEMVTDNGWSEELPTQEINAAYQQRDRYRRFQMMVDIYDRQFKKISLRNNKPDIILCCISDQIFRDFWSVTRFVTKQERKIIKAVEAEKRSSQLSLFGLDVEETTEDLLFRDFRRALKARAIVYQIPIQICTDNLLVDSVKNQDASIRAWNFSVATYYKSGGIPWRLKIDGPETCFVGISFNHIRTTHRHLVKSSIAQAFSNRGDGFAIKGENIPYDKNQGKSVHLTLEQAFRLGKEIVSTYREHTGVLPMRMVLHKTSSFNDEERKGFQDAFGEIPLVEFVNLLPTSFRLLRIGQYPPKRGSLCQLGHKNYFFSTGFMPELGTYPGPHIPSPARIITSENTDIYKTCQEILGLSRMNWNTAGITSGQPVTFFFARNIGGIISELGDDMNIPTAFKYFM
ncbi:MAG: hypothetical protein K2X26_06780 [Chitinophagaceae bacterium]|nr:hypothetical protein [Chitinophagaceae bacterium]